MISAPLKVIVDHVVFEVDAPPSVNASYRNVSEKEAKAFKRRGRTPTEELKAWRHAAGWQIAAQRVKAVATPCEILVEIGECNIQRDVDNFLKAVCDLTKEHGIIPQDNLKHVERVSAHKAFDRIPAGKVRVTISSREAAVVPDTL